MIGAGETFRVAVKRAPAPQGLAHVLQPIDAARGFNVTLWALRGGTAEIVGVLQFSPAEWMIFSQICRSYGIEIVKDVEREPAVSFNEPKSAVLE